MRPVTEILVTRCVDVEFFGKSGGERAVAKIEPLRNRQTNNVSLYNFEILGCNSPPGVDDPL